jgi:hypothetical protein
MIRCEEIGSKKRGVRLETREKTHDQFQLTQRKREPLTHGVDDEPEGLDLASELDLADEVVVGDGELEVADGGSGGGEPAEAEEPAREERCQSIV